jgi:hypothetical protein
VPGGRMLRGGGGVLGSRSADMSRQEGDCERAGGFLRLEVVAGGQGCTRMCGRWGGNRWKEVWRGPEAGGARVGLGREGCSPAHKSVTDDDGG